MSLRAIFLLALPENLLVLLDVHLRPGQLRRQAVAADDDRRLRLEEAVDVLERAVGRLGVEEVGDGDEGEADGCLGGVLVGGR